jgi:CelD/BcsL family acetyltransferase involved in cellulose biosynthesis
MTVDVISSWAEFIDSRDSWNRLAAESRVSHPFVSHVWLTTWWENFGIGKQLKVYVVKRAGEWIAAAPMMVHTVSMYGVPVRRLDSLYNFHSPRYEFLSREDSDGVNAHLWKAMSREDEPWDVIVFQQFLSESPTLTRFRSLAKSDGWYAGEWAAPASPFIPLGCPYDHVLNRLSKNMRQNLRKRHAKLSEVASVDLEIVSDPADVPLAMQDALRIEAAAWKGTAGTAMISNPRVARFYTQLANRTALLGSLRLVFLRVGGKRIAFNYVLEIEGVLYGLKIGYDPEYAEYSPGNMLRSLLLDDACTRGCAEYDLLGSSEEWKLAWTKDARTHSWLFLYRNHLVPRALYRAKFHVVPKLRQLLRVAAA